MLRGYCGDLSRCGGGSANERKSGYSGVRPPCQELASESTTVNTHQVTGNAGAEERSLELGVPYLIRFCRLCLSSLRNTRLLEEKHTSACNLLVEGKKEADLQRVPLIDGLAKAI